MRRPRSAHGFYWGGRRSHISSLASIDDLDVITRIDFLIDTGCTITTIMPQDLRRIIPDFHNRLQRLHFRRVSYRPGQKIDAAPLRARLTFQPTEGHLFHTDVTAHIAHPRYEQYENPSVIGIDALKGFIFRMGQREVSITPAN